MPSACMIVAVEKTQLAMTEAEIERPQISQRILGMFDLVYSWLKSAPVKQTGHNFALYDRGVKGGVLVRVGFPVSGRFDGTGAVNFFELAAGRAAHSVHIGPYGELHRTYAQLESWCREQGLHLDSQSWEIYGDWNEDQSKLETGIYLRLRDA